MPIGGFAGAALKVISRDLQQKQNWLQIKGYPNSAGSIESKGADRGHFACAFVLSGIEAGRHVSEARNELAMLERNM